MADKFIDDLVMVLDIMIMLGKNATELRTHSLRIADDCSGFNAIGFGFVRGRDGTGEIGYNRNDGYRPSPQFRMPLLLDAREVAVEVEEKPGIFGQGLHDRLLFFEYPHTYPQ